MNERQPSKYEGGFGALIGLGSLIVQGVFLVMALQNPHDVVRWIIWIVVLLVIVGVDALLVRALVRRRP
jgi:membrane protein DedA with SNARE-associated domain